MGKAGILDDEIETAAVIRTKVITGQRTLIRFILNLINGVFCKKNHLFYTIYIDLFAILCNNSKDGIK